MIDDALDIPEGVTVTVTGPTVTMKGPKGEVSRNFGSVLVTIAVQDNKITLKSTKDSKRERAIFGSSKAHLRNMLVGATQGHHYNMKIFSGHFPMTVTVSNNEFQVKNFIGEKTPRTVKLQEGVTVVVKGADITIDSCDIEKAGATISAIEQLTKRTNFDRRIFQDAIVWVKS